nr:hypothetical protein BaRGS_024454 [Batillaria attramentaria]
MSPVPASNNSSVPSSVIHGGGGDTTPPGIYYTVGTVMTVGSLVGVFFNGMALVVFAKHKHLRTPTNSFVMALCGCDLFMCLIGMPIAATYSWRMRPIESEAVCVFDAFAVYFLGLSSMYLLAAISVDRYIVIVRPLASSSVTHRMSSLAIGMCFLFGLFWTTMPLLGWNRYTQEGIGVQCSVEWESGDSAVTSYIFSIFVFCFLLPLTVMVFCYANIYKAVSGSFPAWVVSSYPGWGQIFVLAFSSLSRL